MNKTLSSAVWQTQLFIQLFIRLIVKCGKYVLIYTTIALSLSLIWDKTFTFYHDIRKWLSNNTNSLYYILKITRALPTCCDKH